jgi:pathogenesis-related protein 1
MRKRILIGVLFLCTGLFLVGLFFVLKQYSVDVQEGSIATENNKDIQIIIEQKAEPKKGKEEIVAVNEQPKKVSIEKEVIKDVVLQEKPQPVNSLSYSDIQTILSLHNKERSSVGNTQVSWSPTLASQAQVWADSLSKTCVPSHASVSMRKGNGENIWAGYGYGVWNVSEMVRDWISEKQNYTYETNTCIAGAMCGHYTQVVWNTTTEIGCGITSCADRGEEGKIFVCRYSPAGNIQNKKPY